MKLYLVHVGFYDAEVGIYELHSNILVAATDTQAAKKQIKANPLFINKKMHIDGIQEINQVDGYAVKLEQAPQTNLTNQNFGYDQVKALAD